MLDKFKKVASTVVESVAGAVNSGMCMAGWHSGDYEHIKGKPLCHVGKTCPDCGEYVTKENHEFSSLGYVSYDSCKIEYECIHCRYKKSSIEHKYKEQGKDKNCRIIEVCIRCNDKKEGKVDHNWIQIPFTETDAKFQGKRKCKDCGFVE